MVYTAQYLSPVGQLVLASDGERLTGLWLKGQKYFALPAEAVPREDIPVFQLTSQWLDRYFAREQPSIQELPLSPAGSPFRQAVWELLQKIPYGQVTTYGDIARELAARLGQDSTSSQAGGGAVGHNPISIIIPCHRVVGTGGSLTGYAGGIDKKIFLLTHEGVDVSRFSRPKQQQKSEA